MTRQEKARIIDDLVDQFRSNEHVYFTDASGLSVAQVNNLRRLCHGKGIKYGVYKNTLIKKALENLDTQADYSDFTDQVLKGFTGIMFVTENSKLPAQTIKEFRKASNTEKPLLKGASIDSDLFIGEDKLDMLSKLKTKEELIGDVITLLQSPMSRLLGQLTSGRSTLAGIVKTLSEREG
jgi:large subunit ribosomal protein L10